jgi:hypothetical protein
MDARDDEIRSRARDPHDVTPDGRLELLGQGPISFLLEFDPGTVEHERLNQKARR